MWVPGLPLAALAQVSCSFRPWPAGDSQTPQQRLSSGTHCLPSCPWAVQLQRGVFEVAALPGAPQLLQASGAWPQFVSSISEVVGVRVREGGLKVLLSVPQEPSRTGICD